MLYGGLQAVLQLSKEEKVAVFKCRTSSPSTRVDGVDINFTGQGRYSRNFNYVRAVGNTASNWKPKTNRLDISGCFNCDDPNHIARKCPLFMNAANAAVQRL